MYIRYQHVLRFQIMGDFSESDSSDEELRWAFNPYENDPLPPEGQEGLEMQERQQLRYSEILAFFSPCR